MMRLSEALTRFITAGAAAFDSATEADATDTKLGVYAPSFNMRTAGDDRSEFKDGTSIERPVGMPLNNAFCDDGLTSSSQVNIVISNTS